MIHKDTLKQQHPIINSNSICIIMYQSCVMQLLLNTQVVGCPPDSGIVVPNKHLGERLHLAHESAI